jgi:hypothetical protein
MMLGFATATIVELTRIMKKPTSMAHNVFQGLAGWVTGAMLPALAAGVAGRVPRPRLRADEALLCSQTPPAMEIRPLGHFCGRPVR